MNVQPVNGHGVPIRFRSTRMRLAIFCTPPQPDSFCAPLPPVSVRPLSRDLATHDKEDSTPARECAAREWAWGATTFLSLSAVTLCTPPQLVVVTFCTPLSRALSAHSRVSPTPARERAARGKGRSRLLRAPSRPSQFCEVYACSITLMPHLR